MERVNASASRIGASVAESGDADVNSYLGAAAVVLADREVRRRLKLVIQAYDLLAASSGVGLGSQITSAGRRVFSFGPFRLFPSQRLLLEGHKSVQIGSRAFDILTTLVERAGEVVGKDELIARVWPNVYVDDSNLKTQVSGVRRALRETRTGGCYIVTVPGRGYNFVAPVSVAEGSAPGGPDPGQARGQDNSYSVAHRQDAGNVLSLPQLIRALEPCT